MAARRSRGLGQLGLDPRPQGFSARRAAPDAPLHHRGPGAGILKTFLPLKGGGGERVGPRHDRGARGVFFKNLPPERGGGGGGEGGRLGVTVRRLGKRWV